MRAAGLEEINTYISRQKNTVAHYIATCPILELFLNTERRPGSGTPERWWKQEGLVLPGRLAEGEEGGDIGGDREEVGDGDKREAEAEGIMQQQINHRDGA